MTSKHWYETEEIEPAALLEKAKSLDLVHVKSEIAALQKTFTLLQKLQQTPTATPSKSHSKGK